MSSSALYEAMFTLRVDLTFAKSDTPAPLHAAFIELREALAPLAGDLDVETFTEVVWSALHGLATLSRAGRLRPAFYDQRLATLVEQLGTARVEQGNLANDHGDRSDTDGEALPKKLGTTPMPGSSKRPTRKRQ